MAEAAVISVSRCGVYARRTGAPHRVRRFARKVPYSGTNPLALELDQRRADRDGKLLLIHPDAARLDGGPALELIQDAAKAQKSTTFGVHLEILG